MEWEQGGRTSHTAAAFAGAFLGAALGADCFLAVQQLLGLPAFLCGAVTSFCAVTGGELLSGRKSRGGALLALPFVLAWGCFANHLSFALAAAPGDPAEIWKAFAGTQIMFASDSAIRYWLRLSGLMDTALAVWVILYLRARRDEALAGIAAQPCRISFDPPPADMEFFLPWEPWIRPIHAGTRIGQGVCLALLFLCGWMGALAGHERVWRCAMDGMAVSAIFAMSGGRRSARICQARSILYVRADGELWCVAMNRIFDPELHVPLSRLARMWDKLSASRQKLFRAVVAEAVAAEDGTAYLVQGSSLERQSRWEWVVSNLKGATSVIPKVYPNFSPIPGAERAKGPLPSLWGEAAVAVILTVICTAAGCGLGLWMERGEADVPVPPSQTEAVLPDPVPSASVESEPVTAARVPEKVRCYYLNGLTFQTDAGFDVTLHHIKDERTGVDCRISMQYGVGEEAVWAALEKTPADQVRGLRPDSSELLWRMGENTVVYQYNLRTAYLPDGQIVHTGAALSERGTLFLAEAAHGGEADEETVRGDLLYLLENLQFTGPAITEENYQEQLRPAVGMGFSYCGWAYLRAPDGLFGHDALVGTFLPCGGVLHYYDDGLSVMTSVHGLRVSAAIVPSEGTAMDVLDQIYQDLKAAGRRYDEQNVFEEAYSPERNAACRVTVYYDGGRTRLTVLYTEGEWDGYYLFKEMTCLPEEIDEEYSAVFKEMEATCSFSVPYMEDMGRYSQ